MTDSEESFFKIDQNHPSLDGHFPDNPIVPGAIILNHVMVSAERTFGLIKKVHSVKFIEPLLPGIDCQIRFNRQDNRVTFEVTSERLVITKGLLEIPAERNNRDCE